jgi:hypothetical protein
VTDQLNFHSYRTRQLDAWFRDCVYQFCRLKSQSRAAIRDFLQLVVHTTDEITDSNSLFRASGYVAIYTRNLIELFVVIGTSTAYESEVEKQQRAAFDIQKGLSLGLMEGSRAVLFEYPGNGAPSAATMTRASTATSKTASTAPSIPTKKTASQNKLSANDDDDDSSVLSGDSKISGASGMSFNTKIKKKRKTLINTMWETMSSVCSLLYFGIV